MIKQLDDFLSKNQRLLYLLLFILGLIAYLINLGLLPLFADEPIRGVVALEMMFSENYWVPTTNGEFYYKKPPLYNWILIGFFSLFGSLTEFVFRLPSIIPLFLFGVTIYVWVKKFLDSKTAFFAAAMYVTCGRILIYASLLGHIDILYSWLTFLGFIALIEGLKRENWWIFFIISYLISGFAFLSKGLPTLIFQGSSIFILLLFSKKWKLLFHWKHLIGLSIFLLLVSGYFWKYSQYNSLEGWVYFLWDQSVQRTVIDKAWYHSIIHLFKFPLDHIYHLTPWSLFVVFAFDKKFWKKVWSNIYLKNLSLIFLINIPVYWLSPGYYPRYLFMLYPIVFIIFSYAYFNSSKLNLKRIVNLFFLVCSILIISFPLIKIVIPYNTDLELWKYVIVFALAGFAFGVIKYSEDFKFIGFTLTIIAFRFVFSWYVLPIKFQESKHVHYKEDAISIAEKTVNDNLKVLKWTPISHVATYYIEKERREILTISHKRLQSWFYLVNKPLIKKNNWIKLDSMTNRFNEEELYLVKEGVTSLQNETLSD